MWLLGIIFFTDQNYSYADKLIIQLQKVHNSIKVNTLFSNRSETFTIFEQTEFISKSNKIYEILDGSTADTHRLREIKLNKLKRLGNFEIEPLLQELGQYLFSPIQTTIDRASEIEFVITKDLIKIPLDIYFYKNKPLFLQKPVLFSFEMFNEKPLKISRDWNGFIISDVTADPDRGVLFAKKLFPNLQYFDIEKISLKKIRKISKADIILISAHGFVDTKEEDCINIKNEDIYPDIFSHLHPKIVYLDSCQLGISRSFIEKFQDIKVNYYLAPILSNEAGNSSIKTIKWFFEFLVQGQPPTIALFKTRKALYDEYKHSDTTESQEDFVELMWRAFAFRAYHLNE